MVVIIVITHNKLRSCTNLAHHWVHSLVKEKGYGMAYCEWTASQLGCAVIKQTMEQSSSSGTVSVVCCVPLHALTLYAHESR